MSNTREPVHLRERLMPSGRKSLYLDIFSNGRRTYEYLHLYIVPERTREDREQNRQTRMLADAIKAQRLVDYQNGRFGFSGSQYAPQANFIDYYRIVLESKQGSTRRTYEHALAHLVEYAGESITFQQMTAKWFEGFIRYMTGTGSRRAYRHATTLHHNSAALYIHKVRAVYLHAVHNNVIAQDALRNVKLPTIAAEEKSFLTFEELKQLTATPCPRQLVRDMFLFSCLTGLRRSDIMQMTWGMLEDDSNGSYVYKFRHQKTGKLQYLQISRQAAQIIGERGHKGDKVFDCPFCRDVINKTLDKWAKAAGIDKHITFHTGRHTFAVVMLEMGVDIYTIQGLLNHASIATTQVYAKILDKAKRDAVNLIPELL